MTFPELYITLFFLLNFFSLSSLLSSNLILTNAPIFSNLNMVFIITSCDGGFSVLNKISSGSSLGLNNFNFNIGVSKGVLNISGS